MTAITGVSADTIYVSQGRWKDGLVTVTNLTSYFCTDKDDSLNCEHELVVMHHYDGDKHYCPAMFLSCRYCMGIADEPDPYECTSWGE